MAGKQQSRSSLAPRALLACALLALVVLFQGPSSELLFTGLAASQRAPQTMLTAESDSKPPPSEVNALVPLTKENSILAASVLSGLVGTLVGGLWIGGVLFVASSYITRKQEGDVSSFVASAGENSLKALNYLDSLTKKYEVTDKLGSAVTDAWGKVEDGEGKKAASGVLGSIKSNVETVDKDYGIAGTVGGFLATASETASDTTEKVLNWGKENKVYEQVSSKVEEVTKNVRKP